MNNEKKVILSYLKALAKRQCIMSADFALLGSAETAAKMQDKETLIKEIINTIELHNLECVTMDINDEISRVKEDLEKRGVNVEF